MLHERCSRRESGKKDGAFLRNLEDYGEEFKLHSAGDWQLLGVFEQSDDRIRVMWIYCSLPVIV